MTKTLILILGDQLSTDISSLKGVDPANTVVLMVEASEEATYVRHHKKKIALILSAMRHFAGALRKAGWEVDYVTLDDPGNTGNFTGETDRAISRHSPEVLRVTEPSEYRVSANLNDWARTINLPVEFIPDTRFIASHLEFQHWAKDRKQLRMEFFYREMRRKTGLLMDGDQPEGGKWNYDSENRKPPKVDLLMPSLPGFKPDQTTEAVLNLVETRFPDHIGTLRPFQYAVRRLDALKALDHFIDNALPRFGDYQDAMLKGEPFLYHSILSGYLNIGLLGPLEVCQRVENAYRSGHAPLNAAEGYIRQIIGWREFVRGIYWLKMPGYVQQNHLNASRPLPDFYWTGVTEMACMADAIGQTIEHAYAHHIQRLMVTGNFAMLAGVNPQEVHEWYLAVYWDAFEWVELPNTVGMSQFGDGGLLGSKPYAASGNYISKMSDYCKTCRYDVKQKAGTNACPFNSLYWDFLVRNRETLAGNPRLGQVYRTWEKMTEDKRDAYRKSARAFLESL